MSALRRPTATVGLLRALDTRPRDQRLEDWHYDFIFVDRAPLPPHERPWRHPSELVETRTDVQATSHGLGAALASGTLAVVIVAALVVSMTPRRSAPIAISATTTPAVSQTVRGGAANPDARQSFQSVRLSFVNAIPSAIAAVPLSPDSEDAHGDPSADTSSVDTSPVDTSPVDASSAILPELTDLVLVLTEHYAYAVPWSDVARLSIADEAIVVDSDGSVVGQFSDGRLTVTADAKIGSALALTAND